MRTFVHADIRAPRSGMVTHVELSDAGTVVSASIDRTMRLWDVATGAQKKERGLGKQFTFSTDKQTAGKYVVTNQDNLLLVHLTDTAIASANEKVEQNKKPVAFFRAPAQIQTLHCAGDKIAVGCKNGEVLHLRAAFLVAYLYLLCSLYLLRFCCMYFETPFVMNFALMSGISTPHILNNSV